jgi:hypothetical protein
MARAARPINPDDGPIQSFAFDLRTLREAAGNPTYRSLARVADFSATTLGDAAGGVKLPTLEVTLAYVGACGGDTAQWQKRWQSVNRDLAAQRSTDTQEPPASVDAVGGSAVPRDATDITNIADTAGVTDIEDAPHDLSALMRAFRAPKRMPLFRVAAFAAAAFALGLTLSQFGFGRSAASVTSPAPRPSCPASPPQSAPEGGFLGQTYGAGANVRSGASLSAPIRERFPAGCTLQFSGFCLGEIVKDTTADTPDIRWFILPGQGEVASAIVHGNPPPGMEPQPCPDSVPGPTSITMSVSAAGSGGGVVGLQAAGGDLWIVGFAAYYGSAADGAPAQWHQLGLASSVNGSFGAMFRPAWAAAPEPAGIPVVAVACLGGDGATKVVATGAVLPGRPAILTSYPLGGTALTSAEQAACRYPTGT